MHHRAAPAPQRAALPRIGIGATALLLYAVVVAAYAFPGIADRPLYYRDEVRYGGIVLDMMARDAWLTQAIAGAPYLDKGPVYFMALRAAAELAGGASAAVFLAVNAITVWAFAVLSHLGLRRLGAGEAEARLAGLILLSLPFTALYANTLRMDALFGGVIFLSFAVLTDLLRRPAWGSAVAGGLLAGVAVLIKGPFGVAFPFLGLAAVALADRRAPPAGPLGAAVLAAALPVAVWFAALLAEFGGAAMRNILEVQLVERAVNSVDGRKPWWTYLVWLPVILLPWLALAPALRRVRRPDLRAGGLFALAALVVMQVVAQKSAKYLFPVLPPLAMGLGVAAMAAPRALRIGGFAALGLALGGLMAAVGIGGARGAAWLGDLGDMAEPVAIAGLAAWGVAAAGALGIAGAFRGMGMALATALASALLLTGIKATLRPGLDARYDLAPLLAPLERAREAETPVLVLNIYRGAMSWHLRGPHSYVYGDAGLEALASAEGPLAVVLSDAVLAAAPELFGEFEIVSRERIEARMFATLLRQ